MFKKQQDEWEDESEAGAMWWFIIAFLCIFWDRITGWFKPKCSHESMESAWMNTPSGDRIGYRCTDCGYWYEQPWTKLD